MGAAKPKLDFLPPSMRGGYTHLPEDEVRQMISKNLRFLGESPAFRKIMFSGAEFVQGPVIAKRLIVGACARLGYKVGGDSLDPVEVGMFLATLSSCERGDWAWEVRRGLKRLGIERLPTQGRPKGRKSERQHYITFKVFQRLIEEKQLWKKKQEVVQKSPNSWTTRLRRILKADGWTADEVQLAITSRHPRSLALKMAAHKLKVDYDTVQKSVRRVSRAMTPDAQET
jgi:hypothetical protein